MTNADKIRQMSDEQLAVWLCMITAPRGDGKKNTRFRAWCEWLSQDVTDNRAVEVVRCKDCLMWDGNNCASRYGLLGPRPDDYCSIGKRRVDNR